MVINIESFYQSKNSLRIENSLDNPIDQENELYIELNEYLFDIIETIKGELKNISRTRQSNWKELKKKPRILSKYMTINSDSKYNLEINKINTSNIDIIIDSLNKLIEKDVEKDSTVKKEKLQYIFVTIINKYLCENKESLYYLELLWKLSDTYKDAFNQFKNKLIELIEGEDSQITDVIEFKFDDNILEIKQHQFEHLGALLSFFLDVDVVTISDITTSLLKNNESINGILEWNPINKLALEFRLAVYLNFVGCSVKSYYQKLDSSNRDTMDNFINSIVKNSNVPIKIKASAIELNNKIGTKKKTEEHKQEQPRRQENTGRWNRKPEKPQKGQRNDRLSKKNDNEMKGNTHYKGKNMDFRRNQISESNTNTENGSTRRPNNRGRRSGRRNDYTKKPKSEYDWVQV